MKILPCHMPEKRQAVHFTEKTLLPTLQQLYGDTQYFFSCLIASPSGAYLFQPYIQKQREIFEQEHSKSLDAAVMLG